MKALKRKQRVSIYEHWKAIGALIPDSPLLQKALVFGIFPILAMDLLNIPAIKSAMKKSKGAKGLHIPKGQYWELPPLPRRKEPRT